jgi:hypothetical protein
MTMAQGERAKRADAAMGPVRPIPGSRAAQAQGMHEYVISLKSSEEPEQKQSRSQLYEAGRVRTLEITRRLREWIAERGLSEQVESIGEPTAFPIIAIRCTPEVAAALQQFPDAEAVVPDRGDIRIHP